MNRNRFAAHKLGNLLHSLARTREFDADLEAAGLTGDPGGLAAALQKLARFQTGWYRLGMLRRSYSPNPSMLETHPVTEERIRRLLSLGAPAPRHLARISHRVAT